MYAFGEFRSQKTVIINLDQVGNGAMRSAPSVDKAVGLAVHEGFHYLFQMTQPWVAQFVAVERKPDLDYVSAVYYRRMLIKALTKEIRANRSFGRTAFWFQKWQSLGEGPETRYSDVLEGTAHYVEFVSSLFAEYGCEIKEEKLMEVALERINSVLQPPIDVNVMKKLFLAYVQSGYQTEGYEIGLLSLLALRKQGRLIGSNEFEMGRDYMTEVQAATDNATKLKAFYDLEAAKKRVKTPVEILLENAQSEADEDDLKLLQLIRDLTQ